MSAADLRALIREIPDFPKPGILFKDITPLLLDPPALHQAVNELAAFARPLEVDLVIAAEARGFILGAALARELGAGFVPARKPGRLPSETVSVEYVLEYGIDALEVHADAFARDPCAAGEIAQPGLLVGPAFANLPTGLQVPKSGLDGLAGRRTEIVDGLDLIPALVELCELRPHVG